MYTTNILELDWQELGLLEPVWVGYDYTEAEGVYTISPGGLVEVYVDLPEPIRAVRDEAHFLVGGTFTPGSNAFLEAEFQYVNYSRNNVCPINRTTMSIRVPYLVDNHITGVLLRIRNLGPNSITAEAIFIQHFLSAYKVYSANESVMSDDKGINPDFIKRFPNKIINSGFELHSTDGTPAYWTGTGKATPHSNWEGTVALKLAADEYLEQGTIGGGYAGIDPAWFDFENIRYSFKYRGQGTVRVSVLRYSDDTPVTIIDNSRAISPRIGLYLDYGPRENWQGKQPTFYFVPTQVAEEYVKIRFENVGDEPIYIDAVQVEPDFTAQFPSFYSSGPRNNRAIHTSVSAPTIDDGVEWDIWLEYSGTGSGWKTVSAIYVKT